MKTGGVPADVLLPQRHGDARRLRVQRQAGRGAALSPGRPEVAVRGGVARGGGNASALRCSRAAAPRGAPSSESAPTSDARLGCCCCAPTVRSSTAPRAAMARRPPAPIKATCAGAAFDSASALQHNKATSMSHVSIP